MKPFCGEQQQNHRKKNVNQRQSFRKHLIDVLHDLCAKGQNACQRFCGICHRIQQATQTSENQAMKSACFMDKTGAFAIWQGRCDD